MKKIFLLAVSFAVIFSLSSCLPSEYKNVEDSPDESLPAPQTKEELYSLYDQVDRGMTRADAVSKFGEGKVSLDDYGEEKFTTYFNETKSAGVSLSFDADEKVISKTLYFNDKRNLIPFSGRFESDSIHYIKTDMSVSEAKEIMGSEPLELSVAYLSDGPMSTRKIYCWYNEDSSSFMIHTKNELVENIALYTD